MNKLLFPLALFQAAILPAMAQLGPNGATASFLGSLPPRPTAALSEQQKLELARELAALQEQFKQVKAHPNSADAAIFLKAVRYALDFDEWYDKKPDDSVKKAAALLGEARKRIESLKAGQTPWVEGAGQKVFGFYSKIDDSPQPYGVEIPEGVEWGAGKKPVPMWIWLHGRGDTATDLSFVYSRLMAKKPGQFQPSGTIVIHPFGRYCNGWKSAGETDVFEARDDAARRFNVDVNRVALAGFSMGGAGAWHLGAHFADQWACVHTGAGFVDVKRYQKLTPEKMPVSYEQTLWNVYDVPPYARNFLNVPLVSYSGELDAQRDSAEYMMSVLGAEGLHPPHLIGAGMGHKYHPETLKEVQDWIQKAVEKGRNPAPKKVVLQTRCTQYGKMFWVKVWALQKAWEDTRVEAEIDDAAKTVVVKTSNVAGLDLDLKEALGDKAGAYKVVLDGAKVPAVSGTGVYARPVAGGWNVAGADARTLVKGDGFDGLMDQAFVGRFIVVLPDAPCATPRVDEWVRTESAHFIQRWRSLMRGEPIVKKPSELTPEERDGLKGTLCLWGDFKGNSLLASFREKLPLEWNEQTLQIAGKRFDAASNVPVLAYQWKGRSGRPQRIVLNSGLTFREAHDKTNSLQNPKLPDWAVLDITQPPDKESAGKVAAADFFDLNWKARAAE